MLDGYEATKCMDSEPAGSICHVYIDWCLLVCGNHFMYHVMCTKVSGELLRAFKCGSELCTAELYKFSYVYFIHYFPRYSELCFSKVLCLFILVVVFYFLWFLHFIGCTRNFAYFMFSSKESWMYGMARYLALCWIVWMTLQKLFVHW